MSARYIHFTDAQKEQARQTDLVSLLKSQGEKLKRSGSEYEWRDGSQKVTVRGNLWFHQYERTGGDAVDFVRRYYGKTYPEAVEYLLSGSNRTLVTSPPVVREAKPFDLPPKNNRMSRVYAYLIRRRKIDKDVLDAFVRKEMIYESADYHNAVFVGFDTDGVPRHAHKRGTGSQSSYKGNIGGSLPEYSFHWHGQSDRLYLFEAPIDLLSFISMNKDEWQQHSYGRLLRCFRRSDVAGCLRTTRTLTKSVCASTTMNPVSKRQNGSAASCEKKGYRPKSSPQLSKTGMRTGKLSAPMLRTKVRSFP